MIWLSPRDAGALIDDAIAMYRANARPILAAASLFVFPMALLVGIGQDFVLRGIVEEALAGSDTTAAPPLGIGMAYATAAAGAQLMFFGRAYLDSAILAAFPQMLHGQVSELVAFVKGGLRRYGWYLLTGYLVSIVVAIAAVASFFALLAGGLVVWTLLSLAGVIAVLEDARPMEAIRRSYVLVRRHFWRVLGYLVILSILVALFEGAVASPLVVRQIVVTLQNPDAVFQPTSFVWKVVEGLVLAVAMTLVAPITPLALAHLYTDLRVRSEGMDIIVRARAISALGT